MLFLVVLLLSIKVQSCAAQYQNLDLVNPTTVTSKIDSWSKSDSWASIVRRPR
jgi:hypothetical protein